MFFIQVVMAVLLANCGFDHPGRFGHSFGHSVIFFSCYVIAFTIGLACSYAKRSWKTAILQLAYPVFLVADFYIPPPCYRAEDYQELLGKPKSFVEEELSSRGVHSAYEGHPDGNHKISYYRGMTLRYNTRDFVEKVSLGSCE